MNINNKSEAGLSEGDITHYTFSRAAKFFTHQTRFKKTHLSLTKELAFFYNFSYGKITFSEGNKCQKNIGHRPTFLNKGHSSWEELQPCRQDFNMVVYGKIGGPNHIF